MVYCASSLALAVLELLVHVDPRDVPSDLVAIEIEIPEDLKARTLNPPDLPSDWKLESGKAALQALGATWILSGTEAILRVPSVIVPSEPNLLINPGSAGPRRFKLPVSVGELILSGNRVSARTEEIAIAT